jgi:hypothetical protein
MKRLVVGAVVGVAALAVAQPKGNCVRLGTPLAPPAPTLVSVGGEAGQLSPSTVVLDATLPQLVFDAQDAPTLTVHLHTRGGQDLDGADVAVDDTMRAGPMEADVTVPRRKGLAAAHGRSTVALDATPGEHHVAVYADVVVDGGSVHRGAALSYVVASGELRFVSAGDPHVVGDRLVVPVKVVAPQGGDFMVSATIASGQVAVARSETMVNLGPGAATVELPFAQSDIVEPGPYRLVNVTASGGANGGIVATPRDLGGTFEAAHADHEPGYLRNDEGAVVGVGPRWDPAKMPPGEAPATGRVLPVPPGEPVWPDGSPRPDAPVILDDTP